MIPNNIDIDLGVITENSGTKSFENIAKLVVKNSTYIIVEANGYYKQPINLFLIISGDLILKSDNNEYVIHMPCLYQTRECVRIMAIMPGYDVPIKIEPGTYNVSLKISWTARGSGKAEISFSINILEVTNYDYLHY